eukprot:9833585-Lingulodinium_polyedra.AAC.1
MRTPLARAESPWFLTTLARGTGFDCSRIQLGRRAVTWKQLQNNRPQGKGPARNYRNTARLFYKYCADVQARGGSAREDIGT